MRLMDDPALGRRMGVAGREWVARERSWTANGPRYRAVYDDVLARWAAEATSAGDPAGPLSADSANGHA